LSLNAAAEFAVSLGGPVWLALGDMGELGGSAERLHSESGARLRALGVERLYAVGPMSRHAIEAFGKDGRWFESQEALSRALRSELKSGVTVLVKGSRSMRMERVVESLRSSNAAPKTANGDH
jgi:UDP-N-acetylmuramoyl-tripeptide--D-alanyl-D-alanine ligase